MKKIRKSYEKIMEELELRDDSEIQQVLFDEEILMKKKDNFEYAADTNASYYDKRRSYNKENILKKLKDDINYEFIHEGVVLTKEYLVSWAFPSQVSKDRENPMRHFLELLDKQLLLDIVLAGGLKNWLPGKEKKCLNLLDILD